MEFRHEEDALIITGPRGQVKIGRADEAGWKLAMLLEGECEEETHAAVAARYGFSKQRYYQLRAAFQAGGTAALVSRKRGPKTHYRRSREVERQVIRYRYLDPELSAEVIGQKLRQDGQAVSNRSVYRVFNDYGLQKKSSTPVGSRRPRR